MPFLDALRQFFARDRSQPLSDQDRLRMVESWGLSETSHPEFPDGRAPVATPEEMAAPPATTDYDITQWRRKLARVLDQLPDSQPEWDRLLTEGRALNLGNDWMHERAVEEFTLLIRRLVADRRLDPQDQRKLDLARSLIGLKVEDADQIVRSVVAEAESFFGGKVEGA